jgi:hypothetical protein
MDYEKAPTGPLGRYGYGAVGPGWHPILRSLDSVLYFVLSNAKVRCEVRVDQIKEKFGGLRIYWASEGLTDRDRHLVSGAVLMAENMSYRTCEKCGDNFETETRPRRGTKLSRTLTLCELHHAERDMTGTIQLGKSTI